MSRRQLVKIVATFLFSQSVATADGAACIILGAGLSKPFGLPDWPELLFRLYAAKGETCPSDTPERQAEYFRATHYKNDVQGLLNAVYDGLYAKATYGFSELRKNNTLAAIGALIMASQRGSVADVVTFNYDDLLELYLKYHGFVVASIHRRTHWHQSADVTLYHPHGFLPTNPSDTRSDDIVLDQSSYSQVIGKDNDVWRQTILNIMRRKTCIFIGISGQDNNLDSMMHECQKQHASSQESSTYWGVTVSTSGDKVPATLWQRRGVYF